MNLLLQMEAKPVKNASSLLKFSGHSELETGLLLVLFIDARDMYGNSHSQGTCVLLEIPSMHKESTYM